MHAAALVIDDKAIAFLGRKGGGKTTVAIALLGAGHRLLADDLLALHWEDGDLLANPGYPMLRLWPEQADYFLGDHVGLPLVHPAFTKRRVHLAADQFHSAPAPLRRIYVPQRVTEGPVRLVPLRGRDALGVLLQSPFLGEPTHHLGLAADRFTSLARVARDIGVRSVQIPPGYERLSELVHVIEADLASVS